MNKLERIIKLKTNNSNSIGIIGGADGPTAIFITGNSTSIVITLILISILIIGVLYIIFKKKIHK
jgi:Na+-transporting methylmalonyl-CoA/oxaloacetate decarboxylase beta subunit